MHCSPHGALQQTPSTQNPDWHWPASRQGRPLPIRPHDPLLQTSGATQSAVELQRSAHDLPSGRQVNGAHDSAGAGAGAGSAAVATRLGQKRVAPLVAGGRAAHGGVVVELALSGAVAEAVGAAARRRLRVAAAVHRFLPPRDGHAGAGVVGQVARVTGVVAGGVAADAVDAVLRDALAGAAAGFALLLAAGWGVDAPVRGLLAAEAVAAACVFRGTRPIDRTAQLRQLEIVAPGGADGAGQQ